MKSFLLATLGLGLSLGVASARAGVVFSYPPSPSGGIVSSSWVDPDGSDSDMYAYDDFTLAATAAITEVRWRGGYGLNAPFGNVFDFTIHFYESIAGGSQPHVTNPELPEIYLAYYHVGNNAGETPAGVFGGSMMYDYHYSLPMPFVAQAGVKYWIKIEASQPGYPDWGTSVGTGGNGYHFRYSTGLAMFQNVPSDTCFTLISAWQDLGSGKPGVNGVPKLIGSGSLSSNFTGSLTLTNAKSKAQAIGVVGLSAINAPFLGGLIVPAPDILFTVTTTNSGTFALPYTMPANVPAGVAIYMQYFITDPAATFGRSASNAVVGTTY